MAIAGLSKYESLLYSAVFMNGTVYISSDVMKSVFVLLYKWQMSKLFVQKEAKYNPF